jgi:hypothetical protein
VSPRFAVVVTQSRSFARGDDPPDRLVIVLPNDALLHKQARDFLGRYENYRLGHARRKAQEFMTRSSYHSYRFIDCADGDLSRLPAWLTTTFQTEGELAEAMCRKLDDQRSEDSNEYDGDE